jgi:hypothetical protein
MERIPAPPKVDTVDLVHLLDERFRSVGVMSPQGRFAVNLAWLYDHASNYMEDISMAGNDMADEDALGEVLSRLQIHVDSIINYASELQPEIREIFGE